MTNELLIHPGDCHFLWFSLVIFRVYCADHTYCTLRQPVNATAETIKLNAADKLGLRHEELVLAEIKSSGTSSFARIIGRALLTLNLVLGEKSVIPDTEVSIATCLSINGRIFVSPKDHLDAMVHLATLRQLLLFLCNSFFL